MDWGDIPELCSLYETYDWWADYSEADLHHALVGTDELIVLRDEETGDLVVSARVLPDYTYYAMVFDVIVDAERQGEGLGQEMMAAVVSHPPLSGVTLTLLAREGLVEFYVSCRFVDTESVPHSDGAPELLRSLAYHGNT